MTAEASLFERCSGCGALLEPVDGPVHPYMTGSAACWQAYGVILAFEYSDPALLPTRRLSVDAYAVQHPGDGSRQAVQSVGLHLARLMLQLDSPLSPEETNDVMLRFGARKATLPALPRPAGFAVTVADVLPLAGTAGHARAVRAWARSAWDSWSDQHDFIRQWVGTDDGR